MFRRGRAHERVRGPARLLSLRPGMGHPGCSAAGRPAPVRGCPWRGLSGGPAQCEPGPASRPSTRSPRRPRGNRTDCDCCFPPSYCCYSCCRRSCFHEIAVIFLSLRPIQAYLTVAPRADGALSNLRLRQMLAIQCRWVSSVAFRASPPLQSTQVTPAPLMLRGT